MQITATQIAALLGGTLVGNPDIIITQPCTIEDGVVGGITFLANPKYTPYIYTTAASVVLVSNDFSADRPISATLIKVADVKASVGFLLERFGAAVQPQAVRAIHPSAVVDDTAVIGKNVSIGACAVIEKGAYIGDDAVIYPQVYIGTNAKIGKNTLLYSGVRVYHECIIGEDCIIHANTVIGSDGFGFALMPDGRYKKVPQVGNVVIGNDVEIGSNTVIDRATMNSTIIRDGAKLDNLIQIAHNVEIGENTVIAALTGVAGSTKLGKNCQIGGQVGFVGHITVADGTMVQAQSGIGRPVKEPNTALAGTPAFDYKHERRAAAIYRQLPELADRLRSLEKFIKEKLG